MAGLAAAAIGTTAAVVNGVRTIVDNAGAAFYYLLPAADPAKANAISEEYVRLFGQAGVPPLMALQEAGGRFSEQNGLVRPQLGRDISPLNTQAAEFWKTEWPFRDAKALSNTDLWLRYSGNRQYYFLINSVLASYNKKLLACVLIEQEEQGFTVKASETRFGKAIAPPPCPAAENVYFTFIVIKNTADKLIKNIQVSYRLGAPSKTVWDLTNQTVSVRSEADFWDFIRQPARMDDAFQKQDQFSSSSALYSAILEPAEATESRISKQGALVNRVIESLKAGEAVIFLLNVYLPDERHLPAYYVDQILLPAELSFDVDGRRIARPFRPPLGEAAARKGLSWGWFAQ